MVTKSTANLLCKGRHPLNYGYATVEEYIAYRRLSPKQKEEIAEIEAYYNKNTAAIDQFFMNMEKKDFDNKVGTWRLGRSKDCIAKFHSWFKKTSNTNVSEGAFEVWFALKYGLSKKPRQGVYHAAQPNPVPTTTGPFPIVAMSPQPQSPAPPTSIGGRPLTKLEEQMLVYLKNKHPALTDEERLEMLEVIDRDALIGKALVCACH